MISPKNAVRALLSILVLVVIVVIIVMCVVQPKEEYELAVETNGTAALDVIFIQDASNSVKNTASDPQWEQGLNWTRDMAIALKKNLPRFQAGLAQFGTKYHDGPGTGFPGNADLGNLTQLPQGIRKTGGSTHMELALCGNDFDYANDESSDQFCTGGGYKMMKAFPPPAKPVGVDCGEGNASQLIMLVADGGATDPAAALKAARWIKNKTEVKIMGILVGRIETAELYALSSCCPSYEMEIGKDSEGVSRPRCALEVDDACPFLVTATDYEALLASSERLSTFLSDDLVCVGMVTATSFDFDQRPLWMLFLLVPLLLYIMWKWCLRLLSWGYVPPPQAAPDLRSTVIVPPPAPVPVGVPEEDTKRWAPVRNAYMINGVPVHVDYGSSQIKPPTAPNAARRGGEEVGVHDTPEAYFASLPPVEKKKTTATVLFKAIKTDAFAGIPDNHISPPLRKFNCGVLPVLIITLILLPLIIYLAFFS